MRATRAYLASLGTTGLLLLAAFAILFVASALLAFNGWPGEQERDDDATVLIDPGRDFDPDTGPAQVAAEAAELADDVAFAPGSAGGGAGGGDDADGDTPGGGPGGPGDGDPDDGDRGPGERVPDDGAPVVPTDPSPPSGDDGDTPPRPDVSLTDGLADGVQSATDFLGDDAVAPISPELGQLVTGTGEALTDLVRALDGTP